jgi:Rps23 Pro-64 3,4-dihydroxylase Tpa1-like proline 4-hydroxylase
MVSTNKKPRIAQPEEEFANGLFTDASVHKLKSLYDNSSPYKHGVIKPLFNDDLLRNVRKEMLESLVYTEKETDIYKVNQSGDLANLDGLGECELNKLESLLVLRNALYSQKFRSFIESLTSTKGLSGTNIDLSINKYTKGCHLLNHDDVIGTRAVSFILYLPDPDIDWLPQYGGRLELYPVKEKGTPENVPEKAVEPLWNSFAFFAVQPGHSFHAVEEVVSDRIRVSIQGWYHYAQPGEPEYVAQDIESSEMPKSTLQQLLSQSSLPMIPYDKDCNTELNEADIEYLSKYINTVYLDKNTLDTINAVFCEESQTQLHSFLNAEYAELLETLVGKYDSELKKGMTPHGFGVGNGFDCRGPPHILRYLCLTSTDADNFTELQNLQAMFESQSFRTWLQLLTSVDVKSRRVETRRFRPGLDYTLALSNNHATLDFNLCLTKDDPKWETGEVGGYVNYMNSSEDQDAAVYSRADDEGPLLSVSAAWNQLTVALRDEGVLKFVKYISAGAPSSRWDIECEYLPIDDSN